MTIFTAISLILKAPSGRDWVRKYYRDNIVGKDNFQFDLDTQLIFTKSKFEVASYMPRFPGQSPHVDIKVLWPLDNPWRVLETPFFDEGSVILLNLSPTVGNDKWMKKGVMMKLAHLGYKPIAVNLPVNITGQIEFFENPVKLGKMLADAFHKMAIRHEESYLIFGGPTGCSVLPYLLNIRDMLEDPETKQPRMPDQHFRGLLMTSPDFCEHNETEFSKGSAFDEDKIWVLLNKESDEMNKIEVYNNTLGGKVSWYEVSEEIALKSERKNKLWPVKEKNEVFMKYVEAFLKNISPELITTAAAPTVASEEPTSSAKNEDDTEESEKSRKRSAGDKYDELISTEGLKN